MNLTVKVVGPLGIAWIARSGPGFGISFGKWPAKVSTAVSYPTMEAAQSAAKAWVFPGISLPCGGAS